MIILIHSAELTTQREYECTVLEQAVPHCTVASSWPSSSSSPGRRPGSSGGEAVIDLGVDDPLPVIPIADFVTVLPNVSMDWLGWNWNNSNICVVSVNSTVRIPIVSIFKAFVVVVSFWIG